jgi:hypothetical protein
MTKYLSIIQDLIFVMLEIIAAFFSGFLAYPVCIYLVFPLIKKSLKEKWNREESDNGMETKKRGRPKGSKNKPKEVKE